MVTAFEFGERIRKVSSDYSVGKELRVECDARDERENMWTKGLKFTLKYNLKEL